MLRRKIRRLSEMNLTSGVFSVRTILNWLSQRFSALSTGVLVAQSMHALFPMIWPMCLQKAIRAVPRGKERTKCCLCVRAQSLGAWSKKQVYHQYRHCGSHVRRLPFPTAFCRLPFPTSTASVGCLFGLPFPTANFHGHFRLFRLIGFNFQFSAATFRLSIFNMQCSL